MIKTVDAFGTCLDKIFCLLLVLLAMYITTFLDVYLERYGWHHGFRTLKSAHPGMLVDTVYCK